MSARARLTSFLALVTLVVPVTLTARPCSGMGRAGAASPPPPRPALPPPPGRSAGTGARVGSHPAPPIPFPPFAQHAVNQPPLSHAARTLLPLLSFDYGDVDPNVDPELALALRVSMEEERARQEAATRKVLQTAAVAAARGVISTLNRPVLLVFAAV